MHTEELGFDAKPLGPVRRDVVKIGGVGAGGLGHAEAQRMNNDEGGAV